jgi:hypothetical protein
MNFLQLVLLAGNAIVGETVVFPGVFLQESLGLVDTIRIEILYSHWLSYSVQGKSFPYGFFSPVLSFLKS